MLVRFEVENYRSIRDKQQLSLVASSRDDLSDATYPAPALGPDSRLLRAAAIYGANASGKTNVLKALNAMANAVRHSQAQWGPDDPFHSYQPFRLSKASASAPATFAVDLLLDGQRYHYGFKVDRTRVLEEWLHAYPKRKKQVWFSRIKDEFHFSKSFGGENATTKNVTRPNSLFLSAAAQLNHALLTPIYSWFSSQLGFVHEANRNELAERTAKMCRDPEARAWVLKLLQGADLGLIDIRIQEAGATGGMPEGLKKAFGDFADALKKTGVKFETKVLSDIFVLHSAAQGEEPVEIEIAAESRGTRTLLALTCAIVQKLHSGGTLCIDELDTSLHPLIALELVRIFNSPSENPSAQLIFNTHDTNLLDLTVLRRDQVWFTEKDPTGATHLYPLTDFSPRKQENLARGYIQGRYGAVPFVGRFDALSEESLP